MMEFKMEYLNFNFDYKQNLYNDDGGRNDFLKCITIKCKPFNKALLSAIDFHWNNNHSLII